MRFFLLRLAATLYIAGLFVSVWEPFFQIPWTFLQTDVSSCPTAMVSSLKELGFKTVSMALTPNAVSIDDPVLMKEEKLAIILGTEGDGLADSTIKNSDYTVCIPMSHGVDSLNVAAASAIAFWQLGKNNNLP